MFWERFYDMCIEKNTKPNPVAKEIGISSGVISKWKTTGALPSGETLIKIADYLDCSVDYLLGRETASDSTNISHVSNSVVMHTNRGNHVSISNGASDSDNQLSEQEEELVRTFRTLDMRRKTTALTFLYELEDQTNENRV